MNGDYQADLCLFCRYRPGFHREKFSLEACETRRRICVPSQVPNIQLEIHPPPPSRPSQIWISVSSVRFTFSLPALVQKRCVFVSGREKKNLTWIILYPLTGSPTLKCCHCLSWKYNHGRWPNISFAIGSKCTFCFPWIEFVSSPI